MYAPSTGRSIATGTAAAERAGNALSFNESVDTIDVWQLDLFDHAGWPMNLCCSSICCVAQTKVQAPIIGRDVTSARQHILAHPHSIRAQKYSRTSCIARTLRASDKFQFHPMMMIRAHIPQQHRRTIDGSEDDIGFAVVKQIAK